MDKRTKEKKRKQLRQFVYMMLSAALYDIAVLGVYVLGAYKDNLGDAVVLPLITCVISGYVFAGMLWENAKG